MNMNIERGVQIGPDAPERGAQAPIPSHMSKICQFVDQAVCEGRSMRVPAADDLTIAYARPRVYPALYPLQGGNADWLESISPGILAIPGESEMGGRDFNGEPVFTATFLMGAFHPGDGPVEGGRFNNASWAGLWELENWMDDLVRALYAAGGVANMPLARRNGMPAITWAIYAEDRTTIDMRPYWAGRVIATFMRKELCTPRSGAIARALL